MRAARFLILALALTALTAGVALAQVSGDTPGGGTSLRQVTNIDGGSVPVMPSFTPNIFDAAIRHYALVIARHWTSPSIGRAAMRPLPVANRARGAR